MRKLHEYPDAIYKAKLDLDECWQEYFEAKLVVDRLELIFEQEASADVADVDDDSPLAHYVDTHGPLTNSSKRANYVTAQKLSRNQYFEAHKQMVSCKRAANYQQAEVERLQDEFEVAKMLHPLSHDVHTLIPRDQEAAI